MLASDPHCAFSDEAAQWALRAMLSPSAGISWSRWQRRRHHGRFAKKSELLCDLLLRPEATANSSAPQNSLFPTHSMGKRCRMMLCKGQRYLNYKSAASPRRVLGKRPRYWVDRRKNTNGSYVDNLGGAVAKLLGISRDIGFARSAEHSPNLGLR